MNNVIWKSGMNADGAVLKLSLNMKLNVIEYEKTDSKGNKKLVKINRLATLAGNNGFGSFIIGKDHEGNKIGIKLTINKITDNEQQETQNTPFELG